MGKKKAASQVQAKAAAKAAKKAKAEKKLEKKETKAVKKGGKDDHADDEDLEAILDKMAREWEAAHKVTEETVQGPPSKRANATLTPCPNGNHLWSIGGEYFSEDGKAHFYNDVYRYTPEKDEWRRYTSPTAPGPRSAHSVVATPAGGGKLFLCGGEFSSLHQNTFHHYRDLWVFDIQTHTWERIETKVRPSARSGHRMAMWKHFIVLFGGFFDLGIRTNYLNDTWLFDTQEYKWVPLELKETDRKPSPRSGFSFLSLTDGVLLHGGYCKEYVKGKVPRGVPLEDTWFLRMSLVPKEIKWEKLKRSNAAFKPTLRSGCTMALWTSKAQGIMFGGVSDNDRDEEHMDSIFHNDMYGFQTGGNGRWLSLTLKKKKTPGGKKAKPLPPPPTNNRKNEDYNEEVEEYDEYGNEIVPEPKLPQVEEIKIEAKPSVPSPFTQNQDVDPDEPVIPFARYNPMLAVLKNILYIYGGIYEQGSKEYTLDDFWSIALDKMDKFVCLKPLTTTIAETAESSDDDDDDDDDGDDDDDDDDDDDENDGEEGDEEEDGYEEEEDPAPKPTKTRKKKEEDFQPEELVQVEEPKEEQDIRALAKNFLGSASDATRSATDVLSTPLPGETLTTFYARSREYWTQKAHETSDDRGKGLRRIGFSLAGERYEEYKPILEEVEKILAEAGLDEEEMRRAGGGGGAGGLGSRNRR